MPMVGCLDDALVGMVCNMFACVKQNKVLFEIRSPIR